MKRPDDGGSEDLVTQSKEFSTVVSKFPVSSTKTEAENVVNAERQFVGGVVTKK
jgi:hypothetical protein